jgi:hypothetical protein
MPGASDDDPEVEQLRNTRLGSDLALSDGAPAFPRRVSLSGDDIEL